MLYVVCTGTNEETIILYGVYTTSEAAVKRALDIDGADIFVVSPNEDVEFETNGKTCSQVDGPKAGYLGHIYRPRPGPIRW